MSQLHPLINLALYYGILTFVIYIPNLIASSVLYFRILEELKKPKQNDASARRNRRLSIMFKSMWISWVITTLPLMFIEFAVHCLRYVQSSNADTFQSLSVNYSWTESVILSIAEIISRMYSFINSVLIVFTINHFREPVSSAIKNPKQRMKCMGPRQ